MKSKTQAERSDQSAEQKLYWAFISYSSKDRKWGQWLHRRLENYPIPVEFRGLEVFDGAVLGKNLRPVFRDRDELAGSSDLGVAILKALDASRFLVVLCSKNAAKSKWVNKEIEDFQAMGKGDRILALILDGEPNATAQGRPDEECFPPALRYPAEPIAGDLRKEGDGKERGFLKILAGIAQLDFDKLYRRHERAMARKRLVAATIAMTLIAAFAALAIFARGQQQIAEKNEQIAVAEKERADKESADKQQNLEAASNADLASALKAWQEDFDAQQKGERAVGFNGKSRWHEAVALLARSLERNSKNECAGFWLQNTISHQGNARWDWATAVLTHEAGVSSASFSPDGTRVVTASNDKTARVWDAASCRPTITDSVRTWAEAIAGLRYADDGELEAISHDDRMSVLHRAKDSLPPDWRPLSDWVLDTQPDRRLSIRSRFTVRQIAERERDFNCIGTVASLTSALEYDYSIPLARLLLANAQEKENAAKKPEDQDPTIPARAAFLRRYDLDRLPDDAVLWTRAAKALNDAPAGAMVGIGPKALPAHTVALPTAENAVALLKDDKPHPAQMNLAHAYLFKGQFEKAWAIHAKYLGTAFEDGRKWNDELLDDFKLLRESGHDHPDMKKIEGMLE